jgi:hypothetical protein
MMRTITLWFLSILLWIAPNSKSLRFEYDKEYYDTQYCVFNNQGTGCGSAGSTAVPEH